MAHRDHVGIRELRQNLSVYLRRVEAGETLRVTDRGEPVALLAPLPERQTPRDRLIAEGRLVASRGHLNELPAPLDGEGQLSKALDEVRRDRT